MCSKKPPYSSWEGEVSLAPPLQNTLEDSQRPLRVIVAALTQDGANRAVQDLEEACRPPNEVNQATALSTKYVPTWGDVFVRQSLANVPLQERRADPYTRKLILDDLMGPFRPSFEQNHLVSLVRQHKPNVIIDCINTATVLSYQDVFTASTKLRQTIDAASRNIDPEEVPPVDEAGIMKNCLCNSLLLPEHSNTPLSDQAENVLLSLTTPPLIRHVGCLQEVAREQQVQAYLKIGTTGTGGMGLNIPYTHSEDRPSRMLLAKSATAFAHSGLLLLWSMTPGAPHIVSELKPAAAIGYKTIHVQQVADRHGNGNLYSGRVVSMRPAHANRPAVLSLREDPSTYCKLGPMRMAVVDMGENGCFTKDEFITITSPAQMELISPEEISELAIEELLAISTGHNVLSAIRGTLLGPGYRAGINRTMACQQLEELCNDQETGRPKEEQATAASVALGKLGPPAISKLLFEAGILANHFETWEDLRDCDIATLTEKLASLANKVGASQNQVAPVGSTENLLSTGISTGVPVLYHGDQLLRGPNISIPEPKGTTTDIPAPSSSDELDEIANKGWIDLRIPNLELWKARATLILEQQQESVCCSSSSSKNGIACQYLEGNWRLYKSSKGSIIDPPAAVAWILAVELGGHRDIA